MSNMATKTRRERPDLVCLSLGQDARAALKDAAAQRGVGMSALARDWILSLTEKADSDDDDR